MKCVAPLLLALFWCSSLSAQAPSRDTLIQSLQKAIDLKPEKATAPPTELNATVESLRKLASDKPDPELIRLLIQYQLTYLSPENDLPARTLGQLFYDQTSTFYTVYQSLKPDECVKLFPYLKFGWSKAIEEKNTSLPQVREKQKQFKKIEEGLINLRSYHADPS